MSETRGINHELHEAIEVGSIITLKGASSHGKSRLDTHGEAWKVKAIKGKRLLTFSESTGSKWWINGSYDPDVHVTAVSNKGFIIGSR